MGFGAFEDAESSTDFVGLSWRFGVVLTIL
jgi:hypothetical protein